MAEAGSVSRRFRVFDLAAPARGERGHRAAAELRHSTGSADRRPVGARPDHRRAGAGGSRHGFRSRDRAVAAGCPRDFRAPRRRGIQASRDCRDAGDRERNIETAAAPRADVVAPALGWVMTMHDKWTDQLSEYLDGELPPEEPAAVESHLRGCG